MKFRSISILRGMDIKQTVDLAEACWALGFDVVEVPVQSEQSWQALEKIAEISAGRTFGAGTVLSSNDALRAIDLGVTLIISPGLDEKVARVTLNAGAVALPGVMTATEVLHAQQLGVWNCKYFPAGSLGSSWITAMRGPFTRSRFIAVGGVNLDNAVDYISAGAIGIGIGSNIEAIVKDPSAPEKLASIHRLADGTL